VNEEIIHSQKNEDDFHDENDACEQKKIGEYKKDSAPNAFVFSAEKKALAEANEKTAHHASFI
jgi:hypothetical protein